MQSNSHFRSLQRLARFKLSKKNGGFFAHKSVTFRSLTQFNSCAFIVKSNNISFKNNNVNYFGCSFIQIITEDFFWPGAELREDFIYFISNVTPSLHFPLKNTGANLLANLKVHEQRIFHLVMTNMNQSRFCNIATAQQVFIFLAVTMI